MLYRCFVKISDACSLIFPCFIKNFACTHRCNTENFNFFSLGFYLTGLAHPSFVSTWDVKYYGLNVPLELGHFGDEKKINPGRGCMKTLYAAFMRTDKIVYGTSKT